MINAFKLDLQCSNKIHYTKMVCPFCFYEHEVKLPIESLRFSNYYRCVKCNNEFWADVYIEINCVTKIPR